jgi:hypothetical protein
MNLAGWTMQQPQDFCSFLCLHSTNKNYLSDNSISIKFNIVLNMATSTGSSSNIEILNDREGFPRVRLLHANGKASAEIYLHGATVVSWKILDNELLFLR